MITKNENKYFAKALLKWYKKNKRDLPWRRTKDPYKIWVSEIILQQTRIDQGINYYLNFIEKFPNIESLAKANDEDVLKIWEGLGYYNRAMNMLHSARQVVKGNKKIPNTYNELIKLKGIGEYTAAAISSICFEEKKAVVDGNVYRVLSRVFNIKTPINTAIGKKKYSDIANKLISNKNFGDYNQAIMDFGSIQCTKHEPKCTNCIFINSCLGFKFNTIDKRPLKNKIILAKKKRILNYFMINSHSKYIFIQKRKKGIWKNLFEFPLYESKQIINEKIIKEKKILNNIFNQSDMIGISLSKKTTHILSHQNLKIFFWEILAKKIKNTNDILKINKTEITKYPFPKPIKIYLNEILS
ncbi:MAG: A/G-specific adenine glycosylase [Flavobacteriales bacterium TMED113]|nr:MAG: A/G-specific adenine glycosylase [Flavobacteriales bacterium TMED113]